MSMTKIVDAPLHKRAFAAISDLLIVIFIGLGFFALFQNIFSSTSEAKSIAEETTRLQIQSGLYEDKEGVPTPYTDLASYADYQEKIVHYYTVFLPKESPIKGQVDYDLYWYNVHVLGLEDSKGIYKDDVIAEPGKTDGPKNFEYSSSVDALAVPNHLFYKDGVLTDEGKASLLRFYYSSSQISAYYNAGYDLSNRSFIAGPSQRYFELTSVYPLAIASFLSSTIFFLVLPLVFKNGETLGKKFFHLCLISQSGYSIKKGQIVLRYLPPILLFSIAFFFFPFTFASMGISLLLFASYVVALATKKHVAIHDVFAFTKVIDERESLFFKDAEEEALATENNRILQEKAAKAKEEGYRKLEEESKHRQN